MHWLLIRGKKCKSEEKNCLLSHDAKNIMQSLVPRTVYVFMRPLWVTAGVKGRKRAHSSSPFCPPNLTISCKFRQSRKQCFLFQSLWASLGGTRAREFSSHSLSPTGDCFANDRNDFALRVTRVSPFISPWRAFLYILDYSSTLENIYSLQWSGKQAYKIDADLTRPH